MTNMYLTETLIERLRGELKHDPIKSGEVRRIKGMGGLYMSLENTEVGEEYEHLITLFIDDVGYVFYRPKTDEQHAENSA